MRLTIGTMMRDTIIATAPATMGDEKKLMNIFSTVMPTPATKLAHTAIFDVFLSYSAYTKGPRNAPARAPHEIPISCAINVGGLSAIKTEITINTPMNTRIVSTCFFSVISFTNRSLIKSRVSVELDVRTSDESVDIDADRTSTTVTPIRISGRVESI